MLTLKELKKIVKVADVEKRIPSVQSLKEHKVVVKEMINADTTISVYDHGYVLYLSLIHIYENQPKHFFHKIFHMFSLLLIQEPDKS